MAAGETIAEGDCLNLYCCASSVLASSPPFLIHVYPIAVPCRWCYFPNANAACKISCSWTRNVCLSHPSTDLIHQQRQPTSPERPS